MRSGVIALRVAAPIAGDARLHAAEMKLAGEIADGDVPAVHLLHLVHRNAPTVAYDLPSVRDLSAGLRVERRLLQHQRETPRGQPADGDDLRVDLGLVVSNEVR